MRKDVLIVEDDPDIRDVLARYLEARGFHPLAATDGADAIELAQGLVLRPFAIVLDLAMPVMDGFEFLERQASAPNLAGVPVILLSGTRID